VESLVDWCATLSIFPHRGTLREDVLPGLRVAHHLGRTAVALRVDEAQGRVAILGVFPRGRDVEAALRIPGD
jgi:toxin ParE1/3/4